jgi:predicted dienelactone hydrolase
MQISQTQPLLTPSTNKALIEKNYHIGFKDFLLNSENLPALNFTIWYPTNEATKQIKFYGIFKLQGKENATAILHDAPLVIVSHGSGGTKYDQLYLIEYLVQHGYVALSIQHEPENVGKSISTWKMLFYRALEINKVIHWLEKGPCKQLIDIKNITVIGFSAGGFTATLLAGAKPNLRSAPIAKAYKASIKSESNNELYNNKIKLLILLAPALAYEFPKQELNKIKIPAVLLTAANDEILKDSTKYYHGHLGNLVDHLILQAAGHYCFNNTYPKFMHKIKPWICNDVGAKREDLHPIINSYLLKILKKYL